MTRLHAKTIPSAFIRLDDTMSDADAFVNVRDLQIRAQNHNKLLARRARQPMFTLLGRDNTDARDPLLYKGIGIKAERASARVEPTCVLRVPIWVPPHCQAATLTGRLAYTNGLGANVKVYGIIDAATEQANAPSTATLTVTSTTHARYSGDIAVPPDAAAQGYAMFSLFIDGTIYGSDLKGGASGLIRNVGTDNGRPYIDADLADALSAGDAVYVSDNAGTIRADIYPRLVVERADIGTAALNGTASTDRLYLDGPFNRPPLVGSDKVDGRSVQGLYVYSLSLWPKAISDFDGGVEMP